MADPYVTIDFDKIEHNARVIVELCRAHGIEVTGVTKGTCGHPEVARAMLRGGVSSIGDSRLKNIHRLRAGDIQTDYMLLRVPALSQLEEVVGSVRLSLNSEFTVLAGLSQAARRRGQVHEVIVMVDLGDLREGIWPDGLVPLVREAVALAGVRIVGLGTNLSCFGGVVPTEQNMNRLVELASEIEKSCDMELKWVSGCNSSALELIAAGRMPKRVNHARIGEAILLGRETVHRRPWPGTFQDTFLLHAEVLELKRKPSLPIGERAEDAFGETPVFADRGEGDRALLNVGREDVDIRGLTPLDSRLSILGGSSGYLILDVTGARGGISVGDEIAFAPNYSALLAAMTSEYVEKRSLRPSVPPLAGR
ncbi:MAG: alanine/ornithine racemase family PLP-dependent enzyme [Alphaproteobacteria bacterium]|nr:alanine/ornithine racemase family PLP-dependent enzyme [Alphaproteobacteria bacterium]